MEYTERKTVSYQHIVTEGTHYEVGQALGASFKSDTAFIAFITSPFMDSHPLLPEAADKAMTNFERYCPGVNQEIQGFADELGVKAETVVFYYSYLQSTGHCSHIALRTAASDSRTYHMRTYDFGWEEAPYNQLLLATTRVTGKAAHIGFALQLFGRYDGMNDEGLSVTTTSGRIRPVMSGEGFVFPGIVRALLNECSTAKEAVTLLQDFPVNDYRSFLVSDKYGDMARIETAGTNKAIEYYDMAKANQPRFTCSTNHYTLPSMHHHNLAVMENSKVRLDTLRSAMEGGQMLENPVAALKELAARPLPEGVCCHHYQEGFGTMWASVFDPSEHVAHICFGSPQVNPWRSIGLTDPAGITEYSAVLPNENSTKQFWSNSQ